MSESDLEKRLEQILHSVLHPLYSSRKQIVEDENAYIDRKVAQLKAAIKDAGYSKHDWSITPGSVRIDGEPHMTGQEFYQWFEKELSHEIYGDTNPTDKVDCETIPYVCTCDLLVAARRAAGIDE